MCSNCYHRLGRVKKPSKCQHQKLYAAGLCQNCYINDYNRRRREDTKAEEHKETLKTPEQAMSGQVTPPPNPLDDHSPEVPATTQ
jgi:hypothetical protein